MTRIAPDPAIVWHWARCVACGSPVYVKESDLLFDAVRPGCCGATADSFKIGAEIDPARAHAKGDAPALRCMSCGHEKQFGGLVPQKETDTMGKVKGKGAPLAGAKNKSNGKANAKQPRLPAKGADGIERQFKRRYHKDLPCVVDPEIQQRAGRELADTFDEQAAIEDERRTVMAGFRSRLNHVKERAKELTAMVRQGTQTRSVQCEDYLLPTNEIETIRLDTGKMVERRAARQDELQLELGAEPTGDDEDDEQHPEPPFGSPDQAKPTTKAKGNGSAAAVESTP